MSDVITVTSKATYSAVQFRGEENKDFVSKFFGVPISSLSNSDKDYFFIHYSKNMQKISKPVSIGDWFVKDGSGQCDLYGEDEFRAKFTVT